MIAVSALGRCRAALVLAGLLAGGLGGARGLAQEATDPADTTPPERLVELETQDGVQLKAMYYPGTKGRDSVCLMMLHAFRGSRADYHRLAKELQTELGYAILVPDLRGHGESVRVARSTVDLTPDRMRPSDFQAMVGADMETLRRFLRDEHNAEQLNLDRLGLIGAEMGAVVAMVWAAYDWSMPPLGKMKQGEFVKALVLLSPQLVYRGLNANQALRSEAFRSELSLLVISGKEDSENNRHATRVFDLIAPHRRREADYDDASKKTLFRYEAPTSLQGTGLLGQNLGIESLIADFTELKLTQPDLPWVTLRRPND